MRSLYHAITSPLIQETKEELTQKILGLGKDKKRNVIKKILRGILQSVPGVATFRAVKDLIKKR